MHLWEACRKQQGMAFDTWGQPETRRTKRAVDMRPPRSAGKHKGNPCLLHMTARLDYFRGMIDFAPHVARRPGISLGTGWHDSGCRAIFG